MRLMGCEEIWTGIEGKDDGEGFKEGWKVGGIYGSMVVAVGAAKAGRVSLV
jgi:hypothetical protein